MTPTPKGGGCGRSVQLAGVSGRERIGFSSDALNLGAVNVFERKAKFESCRCAGSSHSLQGAVSSDLETGLISSNSWSHLEQ